MPEMLEDIGFIFIGIGATLVCLVLAFWLAD